MKTRDAQTGDSTVIATAAKEAYLENLRCRANNQAFGGLPNCQKAALDDCQEILADKLCDAVGVPHGSTIGYSIRAGRHFADLTQSGLPTPNVGQKIRRLARREGFVATKSRRDGKWYFADKTNLLVSPQDGLDDDEALEFLTSE